MSTEGAILLLFVLHAGTGVLLFLAALRRLNGEDAGDHAYVEPFQLQLWDVRNQLHTTAATGKVVAGGRQPEHVVTVEGGHRCSCPHGDVVVCLDGGGARVDDGWQIDFTSHNATPVY